MGVAPVGAWHCGYAWRAWPDAGRVSAQVANDACNAGLQIFGPGEDMGSAAEARFGMDSASQQEVSDGQHPEGGPGGSYGSDAAQQQGLGAQGRFANSCPMAPDNINPTSSGNTVKQVLRRIVRPSPLWVAQKFMPTIHLIVKEDLANNRPPRVMGPGRPLAFIEAVS